MSFTSMLPGVAGAGGGAGVGGGADGRKGKKLLELPLPPQADKVARTTPASATCFNDVEPVHHLVGLAAEPCSRALGQRPLRGRVSHLALQDDAVAVPSDLERRACRSRGSRGEVPRNGQHDQAGDRRCDEDGSQVNAAW
ncbi:hypothetical protein [Variovorax paradoxus]|uniref:hypothetical protein n=1 Tax=Variovorax paradoxus TaxID=34073 RepID=UPI001F41703A|nr:hypothetical protein [Variovorax paradoxus]